MSEVSGSDEGLEMVGLQSEKKKKKKYLKRGVLKTAHKLDYLSL